MNESTKKTMELFKASGIPFTHELSKVECTVIWTTEDDVHIPEFTIGGYKLNTNITVEKADPDDFEGYEEMYGDELEEGRYYYCDGECYHWEMRYREGDVCSEFIADEVNGRVSELNRA